MDINQIFNEIAETPLVQIAPAITIFGATCLLGNEFSDRAAQWMGRKIYLPLSDSILPNDLIVKRFEAIEKLSPLKKLIRKILIVSTAVLMASMVQVGGLLIGLSFLSLGSNAQRLLKVLSLASGIFLGITNARSYFKSAEDQSTYQQRLAGQNKIVEDLARSQM